MEKKLMHNQAYLLNLLDYNSWANDEFFKVIIKLPIDVIQKQHQFVIYLLQMISF